MRGWAVRWGAHRLPDQRHGVDAARGTSPLPPGLREQLWGTVAALALIMLLTPFLLAVRGSLSTANLALLYLIPVLAASTLGGIMPATAIAVACVVAIDIFFVVPYGALRVDRAEDGLTLLIFLGVAVLTSELAARARARASEAARHARATALLYDLSGALAAPDLSTILNGLSERLARIFALHCCTVLLVGQDGTLRPRSHWGGELPPGDAAVERELAGAMAWALENGARISVNGGESGAPASLHTLFVPLRTAGHAVGLLRLTGSPEGGLTSEDGQLLETFATQAALAIERAQLAEASAQAAVLRESDRVKSALLASVSHDLRTPLATIRGAGDALRQPSIAADPQMREEMLSSIVEEAERLSVLVSNLLDLSRIEAGALHPQRHLYDLAEICSRVAARLAPRLAAHQVTLDVPSEMPLVPVDYQQIDAVLANLLDNAAKYTPPGTPVRLRLRSTGEDAVLSVEDEGPGIAPGDRERIFTKFYRVPGEQASTTSGTGLGLAICRGIVEAHGGTIRAEGVPTGGTRIEVRLPLDGPEDG